MVNDMENVLESIGVTKNYAGKAAVENVSLKLETGLVYAMLGPNGSGIDLKRQAKFKPSSLVK